MRLRCQKVLRTEDQDNDGDEQAIMTALQKHSTTTDVMLRLSVRVVQARDSKCREPELVCHSLRSNHELLSIRPILYLGCQTLNFANV